MADDAFDFHVFDAFAAVPNFGPGPTGVSGWQR